VTTSLSKGEGLIRGLDDKKIFGDLGRIAAPAAAPTPAVKRAPMALKLVGTYVAASARDSYAIIEQTQRSEQDVFAVSDSVFDDARLLSIEIDRVFLERDGNRVELTLNEGSADAGSGGSDGLNSVVVSESDVDDALSNLPVLLTQLRAVPYFKNGQAVGLRLFAIKSGSLFEKIGLKNGDILETINGNQLGDFSQALKLFEQLKSERSLRLVLERNRQPITYNYVIR
jgi:general secretion pathway protein C